MTFKPRNELTMADLFNTEHGYGSSMGAYSFDYEQHKNQLIRFSGLYKLVSEGCWVNNHHNSYMTIDCRQTDMTFEECVKTVYEDFYSNKNFAINFETRVKLIYIETAARYTKEPFDEYRERKTLETKDYINAPYRDTNMIKRVLVHGNYNPDYFKTYDRTPVGETCELFAGVNFTQLYWFYGKDDYYNKVFTNIKRRVTRRNKKSQN